MGLPKIVKIAKEALLEGTGLDYPRVVNIRIEKGQYHVIVDLFDGTAKAADRTSRTYDVKIDESGKLRGYSPVAK
jgi:hypothetical protein